MSLEELILDVLVGFDIDLPTSELKTISSHLVDTIEDWMEGEGHNGDPLPDKPDVQVDGLDEET